MISPGTASTSRPSSSAKSAVMSAPLRSLASTTTVARHRPAMMRFRAGKRQGAGSTPSSYSDTTRPSLADPPRELGMRRGIVAVDPASEDGHRDPTRLERSAVRLAVHTTRHPARHDQARGRELPPQRASDGAAVGGARTRTHDRNGRLREQREIAASAREELPRWVVDRREERREVLAPTSDSTHGVTRHLTPEAPQASGRRAPQRHVRT